MNGSKWSTRDLCIMGIMTALTAIMAQISIPMPMGVPFTMQTFAISLAGIVLGAKKGAVSALVYVLLGAVGVPVFANFTGGIAIIFRLTGGFLLSFPLMAYIIGLATEKWQTKRGVAVGITLGILVNYAFGVAMFCILSGSTLWVGLTACVLPFLPTAIVKGVAAGIIGIQIRTRIVGWPHSLRIALSSHGDCQSRCVPYDWYPNQDKDGGCAMRLRPHHLLCTQGYSGRGYSDGFVENMTALTNWLRSGEQVAVQLVFSTDDLCESCPHMLGVNQCETNDKVNSFDRKMIEYFGLEEKTYIYQEIVAEINEKMTEAMMEDICGGCDWYPISACKRNILPQ